MTRTPEGKIKDQVKAVMANFRPHIYSFWPVQTGYGTATLDCLGSLHGVSFSVETKADGARQLTVRQKFIKEEMQKAGIMVFIIFDDATLERFQDWLKAVHLFSGADKK